jgi:hypothetical protein
LDRPVAANDVGRGGYHGCQVSWTTVNDEERNSLRRMGTKGKGILAPLETDE